MAGTVHSQLTGAEAIHQAWYYQEADPGAVGANKLWCRPIPNITSPTHYLLSQRNPTNTGWLTVFDTSVTAALGVYDGGSLVATRPNLNFIGFDLVDDPGNSRVDVAGAGSWVLLDTQTATTSTSLDFIAGIDGTYDEYILRVGGLVSDNASTVPRLRVSTNGGSTFDSGANYGWMYERRRAGSLADSTAGASSGATYIEIMNFSMGTGTGQHQNFTINCASLNSTTLYKVFGIDWQAYVSTPDLSSGDGSGVYLSTTAVDALQIYASVGNFTSGWGRLYGIKK